jgi:sugar transferase (PEP-CTERM/EpsH1 system associated)
MPIRIMHVVDNLGKGGLENGLVNLIEKLDPQRFEHTVCAIRILGLNADRLPRDRVRVICLGKKETDSRFQSAILSRAIREVGPDIVHTRNWAAIEGVFAARWLRTPAVVHSEHGLESDAEKRQPWRRNWCRRLAYGLADRVISVSGELRDRHARHTGFSKDRISVIHNGVDCKRYRPDADVRARLRRELNLSEEDLCIGCVGNLLPIKGHMTLLHALRELELRSNRWQLLLIGDGSERSQLEAFVGAHRDWKHRVKFLGTSTRVPELLNAMDVYVLPSMYEGISNSLLEAMATGLPVLATSVGGNPEVVIDGESGLLFPSRESGKLASLLVRSSEQTELRLKLGAGALRRVREEFSIDSMVQKYDELYENIGPSSEVSLGVLART